MDQIPSTQSKSLEQSNGFPIAPKPDARKPINFVDAVKARVPHAVDTAVDIVKLVYEVVMTTVFYTITALSANSWEYGKTQTQEHWHRASDLESLKKHAFAVYDPETYQPKTDAKGKERKKAKEQPEADKKPEPKKPDEAPQEQQTAENEKPSQEAPKEQAKPQDTAKTQPKPKSDSQPVDSKDESKTSVLGDVWGGITKVVQKTVEAANTITPAQELAALEKEVMDDVIKAKDELLKVANSPLSDGVLSQYLDAQSQKHFSDAVNLELPLQQAAAKAAFQELVDNKWSPENIRKQLPKMKTERRAAFESALSEYSDTFLKSMRRAVLRCYFDNNLAEIVEKNNGQVVHERQLLDNELRVLLTLQREIWLDVAKEPIYGRTLNDKVRGLTKFYDDTISGKANLQKKVNEFNAKISKIPMDRWKALMQVRVYWGQGQNRSVVSWTKPLFDINTELEKKAKTIPATQPYDVLDFWSKASSLRAKAYLQVFDKLVEINRNIAANANPDNIKAQSNDLGAALIAIRAAAPVDGLQTALKALADVLTAAYSNVNDWEPAGFWSAYVCSPLTHHVYRPLKTAFYAPKVVYEMVVETLGDWTSRALDVATKGVYNKASLWIPLAWTGFEIWSGSGVQNRLTAAIPLVPIATYGLMPKKWDWIPSYAALGWTAAHSLGWTPFAPPKPLATLGILHVFTNQVAPASIWSSTTSWADKARHFVQTALMCGAFYSSSAVAGKETWTLAPLLTYAAIPESWWWLRRAVGYIGAGWTAANLLGWNAVQAPAALQLLSLAQLPKDIAVPSINWWKKRSTSEKVWDVVNFAFISGMIGATYQGMVKSETTDGVVQTQWNVTVESAVSAAALVAYAVLPKRWRTPIGYAGLGWTVVNGASSAPGALQLLSAMHLLNNQVKPLGDIIWSKHPGRYRVWQVTKHVGRFALAALGGIGMCWGLSKIKLPVGIST